MDHQYRENGARNIYSNCNQMRPYVVSTFPSSNRQNFEDSRKVLAISVSKFYQSIAVQLYQPTLIRWLSFLYVCKQTTASAIRESLPISVRS